MRKRLILVLLFMSLLCVLSGCCTTQERLSNLGESVHNIALDGDGVN